MKKLIKKISIISLILLTAVLTGCPNFFGLFKKDPDANEKITLYLSAVLNEPAMAKENSSRTASPVLQSDDWNDYYWDFKAVDASIGNPTSEDYIYSYVSSAESNYILEITPGVSWKITAEGRSNSSDVILRGTKTFDASTVKKGTNGEYGYFNVQIPVYYITDGQSNGNINLEITIGDDTGIEKVKITGEPFTNGGSGEFTINTNGKIIVDTEDVPSGKYPVIMEFYKDNTCVAFIPEVINIGQNQSTTAWIKSGYAPWLVAKQSPSFTGEAEFKLTKDVIKEINSNIFYVKGASGTLSTSDSHLNTISFTTVLENTGADINSGSWYAPYATVQAAVNRIAAIGNYAEEYKIYVDGKITAGNESLGSNSLIQIPGNGIKLTIEGLSTCTFQSGESLFNSSSIDKLTDSPAKMACIDADNKGVILSTDGFFSGKLTIKNIWFVNGNASGGKSGGALSLNADNAESITETGYAAAELDTVYISDCTSQANAGGLFASGKIKINMNKCYFVNNSAGSITSPGIEQNPNNGGAVYLSSNAEMTLKNSEIRLCTSGNNGGAVYLCDDTKFTGDNILIYSCKTAYNGGAICSSGNGLVELGNSCEVSDNKVQQDTGKGGGLYVNNLTIDLSNSISANYKESSPNVKSNVFVPGTSKIIIKDGESGGSVYITLESGRNPTAAGLNNGVIFTEGMPAELTDISRKFYSDEDYMVARKDDGNGNSEACLVLSGGSVSVAPIAQNIYIKPVKWEPADFEDEQHITLINWYNQPVEFKAFNRSDDSEITDSLSDWSFKLYTGTADISDSYITSSSNVVTVKKEIHAGTYNLYASVKYTSGGKTYTYGGSFPVKIEKYYSFDISTDLTAWENFLKDCEPGETYNVYWESDCENLAAPIYSINECIPEVSENYAKINLNITAYDFNESFNDVTKIKNLYFKWTEVDLGDSGTAYYPKVRDDGYPGSNILVPNSNITYLYAVNNDEFENNPYKIDDRKTVNDAANPGYLKSIILKTSN